jgi:phage gp36-like protein
MNWQTPQQLLALTTVDAPGIGAVVDLGARDRLLRQILDVSAGNGTLDVRLEASADALSGWRTFATYTSSTTVGAEKLSSVSPERYVRVAWTLTDGPFTFAVSGARGISYANLDDFDQHGVPKAALASRTPSQKAEALAAASTQADGYLKVRYDLPLVSWGGDLVKAICKIAAYEEMAVRGFNPDGADDHIRQRYEDAIKWLMDVAKGLIDPVDLVESPAPADGTVGSDDIAVVTHAARAWR